MTEAERIEKDAEQWCNNYDRGGYEITPTDCYIAGATAENERLQQLIKEVAKELRLKEEEWSGHNTAKASAFDYAASKIEAILNKSK